MIGVSGSGPTPSIVGSGQHHVNVVLAQRMASASTVLMLKDVPRGDSAIRLCALWLTSWMELMLSPPRRKEAVIDADPLEHQGSPLKRAQSISSSERAWSPPGWQWR